MWIVGIVVVGAGIYLAQAYSRIARAERAFASGDLETAMLLASEELEVRPESERARMISARVYMAIKDYATAQGELERISKGDPERYGLARRELGRIAFEFGQASAAETFYRESIEANPEDTESIDQLIFLLTLEGRTREAQQRAWDRLRAGIVTPNYLSILGVSQPSLDATRLFAQKCLSANPGDSLPRLGLALQAWRDDELGEVREQLTPVLKQYPELVEAHALWCRLLVEIDDLDGFVAAHAKLPDGADDHPEIWLARGIWAEKVGQVPAAVRCLGESIRLDPNSRSAHHRLSRALIALGKAEVARPFAERAQRLTHLTLELGRLPRQATPDQYRPIIEQLLELGREWEALAWCRRIALETGSLPDWASTIEQQLAPQVEASQLLVAEAGDLFRRIDWNAYPLPDYAKQGSSDSRGETVSRDSEIRFVDEAERLNIRFTYVNGELSGDSESIMQMNGGGVAVIDYDRDSLPDLYLTQGGQLPPQPILPPDRDQLFRHRGESAGFANVTEHLGLQDVDYGQGVTVGDFDNDGFADLYVGNIGTNRLYHNLGDGSFEAVTITPAPSEPVWTSSSVMADLNQDGHPDLYAVTYLGGDALTKVCDKRSNPRCSPLQFDAEPDRVYLNSGEGTFRDVTDRFGLQALDGRGLGIVAGDFDGSRRLSLFVANDMTANFYFRNVSTLPGTTAFEEQAVLSGLAYDEDGRANACMGVAAGDPNRDGRLDLFVTNFTRQSNDLYLQSEDGSFVDRSREAGISHPSFLPLGWGTQFLDADLDGELDLIVTNGHVYDPRDPRVPFAMQPQFFRNQGHGKYSEVASAKLGPFFEKSWHGRALARLDWNRDGREDACISHNNQPVALLTNQTASPGQWIAFQLTAVDSARDAIGATIHLTSGDQSWTSQLTAGDGFQASNERRLVLGLGERTQVDTVEVIWPSGTRQVLRDLEAGHDWLVVENREPLRSN
jgi:tetratricopeptide (TPR) repeat protein